MRNITAPSIPLGTPNYQKVTVNTAGVTAAAPPSYAAPLPLANDTVASSGFTPASGSSNLSSILNTNWPPISVNQVTVSYNTADSISISDDYKTSYCDIFKERDDDTIATDNANNGNDGDAEIEDADIENSNDSAIADEDDNATSMTLEQLDEAHTVFLATIKTPPPALNIKSKAKEESSSDNSLPALIRSSSSSSTSDDGLWTLTESSPPSSSSSDEDETHQRETHERFWAARWPSMGNIVAAVLTKRLPPDNSVDQDDHFHMIVKHITTTASPWYCIHCSGLLDLF